MVIIIDGTISKSIYIYIYKENTLFLKKESKDLNIYEYLDKFFKSIDISDIVCIGINIGPGSFSSTRSSVAFIAGFSMGSKIPVIGISGFDVLLKMGKPLIIDAMRGNAYIKYKDKFLIKKDCVGAKIDYNVFFNIVNEKLQKGEFSNPLTLLPLYMDKSFISGK